MAGSPDSNHTHFGCDWQRNKPEWDGVQATWQCWVCPSANGTCDNVTRPPAPQQGAGGAVTNSAFCQSHSVTACLSCLGKSLQRVSQDIAG